MKSKTKDFPLLGAENRKLIALENILADYIHRYGASRLAMQYFGMGAGSHGEASDISNSGQRSNAKDST